MKRLLALLLLTGVAQADEDRGIYFGKDGSSASWGPNGGVYFEKDGTASSWSKDRGIYLSPKGSATWTGAPPAFLAPKLYGK